MTTTTSYEESPAKSLAVRLAFLFMKAGQYSASSGPVVPSFAYPAAAAAAADDEMGSFLGVAEGFGGLAVQAVGVEEGNAIPKVHIYVTRGAQAQLRKLPSKIDRVDVRVHKIGAISVRPEAAGRATNRGNIFERRGRVCCGTSCGPTSENSTGTIGAIVLKQKELFLLSNNHVFAGCNHVAFNQPILAPSSNDGRADARAPQEVARHYEIHELRSGDPHFVQTCDADLAIARVIDPRLVSSWQGDARHGYDTPRKITQPFTDQRVKKFGRTTGRTIGDIEARIPTPMAVTYNSKHFKGVVWFRDVWSVRGVGGQPFALPGDSGSLVVSADATAAVGLVFAANPTGEIGWMVPMASIAASFGGIQLVSGHGV